VRLIHKVIQFVRIQSSRYRAKSYERKLRHRAFVGTTALRSDCYVWRLCTRVTGQRISVNQSGYETK